ncbi:hypothetical protein [Aurantiacibacter gilvus]|uniref:Uncharacterized protein n=1 Tax=Aurantiacibacter gilvus TaxID=3139141 RepID=A0ABU9IBR2_9SPHN
MKTRPAICHRKRRYGSEAEAIAAALRARVTLRPYRCELCRNYHLTSRTKGMRSLPRQPVAN